MTNAETNTAATVAEQGAHVAPEKASSKKGTTQKKGAPKGQKAAKGGKAKASLKKEAKTGKKAKPAAHAKEAGITSGRHRHQAKRPVQSQNAGNSASRRLSVQ